MSNYWRLHYERSAEANPCSPLKQVGKTINGLEVSGQQIELIISQIVEALSLTKKDKLLDLGCGNGLLTARLAKNASSVWGVDFAEGLLSYAKCHHSADNIMYIHSSILDVDSGLLSSTKHFSMYEVLQHLTNKQVSTLLARLGSVSSGARFFVGGIPDQERLRNFYDTEKKYEYFLSREEERKPHLGRWWLETEIRALAEESGWSMKRLCQPEGLYTAYYRFDAVLEKR